MSVKGIYVDGVVKLLEKVDVEEGTKAIVTFLSESKREKFFSSAGCWKDLNTEKIKEEIYNLRKILTREEVKL